MVKLFAKSCDIGDASRGSLSSYAYILMLLHFLQQRNPPVVPVLQVRGAKMAPWTYRGVRFISALILVGAPPSGPTPDESGGRLGRLVLREHGGHLRCLERAGPQHRDRHRPVVGLPAVLRGGLRRQEPGGVHPPAGAAVQVREDVELPLHRHRGSLRAQSQPRRRDLEKE